MYPNRSRYQTNSIRRVPMQGMPYETGQTIMKHNEPPEIAPALAEKAYADAIRAQVLAQISMAKQCPPNKS